MGGRKWNSFTSSLDGKMLIEESSCSLPSQDSLASCQLMVMNTAGTPLRASQFKIFPHNESKARNNSTPRTGKIPVVLVPRQTELLGPGGTGCFVPGCLRPSPAESPHLPSPVRISHRGAVPLGRFPTPVPLSSRGWSGCRAVLRGPAQLCPRQQAGTGDSVSFLGRPRLSLPLSAPRGPDRDGATGSSSAGTGSLLCAAAIGSALEAMGTK